MHFRAGYLLHTTKMSRPTFADQTKKQKIQPLTTFNYPTEDQGLIFNHIEGKKIREYLAAICSLIGGAHNIIAASRISGGRVILFLAAKEIVERFQEEHGGFLLEQTYIKTRKLKSPSVKIVLSNVSPTVPNTAIEDLLTKNLKLKLAFPISILRVSPNDDTFSHVISWRRQVYIQSNTDIPPLPNSILLNYGDRSYRIFITLDNLTCFKCNSRGHKAEDCPQVLDEEVEDTFNDAEEPGTHEPIPTATNEKIFPPLPALNNQKGNNAVLREKRGPSTLISSSSSNSESNQNENLNIPNTLEKKKPEHKRQKPNPETNSFTLTKEEKSAITEKIKLIRDTKFPNCDFSAEDLINFLPNSRNRPARINLAKSLTSKIDQLIFILEEIKPNVLPNTKKTITALIKSLYKQHEETKSQSGQSESE